MGSNPICMYPYRKGKFGHGNRHKRGELHVKVKAEGGVTDPPGKKHQRLPAIHQNLGEGHGTDSPPEETNPAGILVLDVPSPEL